MVQIAPALISILILAIRASAAPTSGNSSGAPADALAVSVADILNAPVVIEPVTDPAFEPIHAGSNRTIIAAVPEFAAPVKELPSIIQSISSAAATATQTGGGQVATQTPVSKRSENGLSRRRVPPLPLAFDNIDCNFNPSFPTVNFAIWKAVIEKACHQWFDPTGPPYTSPLQFLHEGSSGVANVGPPTHRFHLEYHVRTTSLPYDAYYAYTGNLCIADLQTRMALAIGPNALGWPTAFGLCFDTSGISSWHDGNSPIWYELTSPPA